MRVLRHHTTARNVRAAHHQIWTYPKAQRLVSGAATDILDGNAFAPEDEWPWGPFVDDLHFS